MNPTPAIASRELSSLNRGLAILDAVRKAGRLRPATVAERVGLPLSTVYRYLNTLRDAGFLIDIDGYFLPSARFTEPAEESDHLVRYAAPVLNQMRSLSSMTALLTVRIHVAAVCLEVAYAHPKHKISFQRGQVKELYAGASAIPLLAFAPDTVIREVLEGEFRRFTSATPQRKETEHEIERVRQDGYCVSYGHLTPGMVGIGVPVIVNGGCLCALSLVGEPPSLSTIDASIVTLRAGVQELIGRMPTKVVTEVWSTPDE